MDNNQIKAISDAIDKASKKINVFEFSSIVEMYSKLDELYLYNKIEDGVKYTVVMEVKE